MAEVCHAITCPDYGVALQPGTRDAFILSVGQRVNLAFPVCRHHGGGVPEHWGRDSPYHPGTTFLGTPPDHLEV